MTVAWTAGRLEFVSSELLAFENAREAILTASHGLRGVGAMQFRGAGDKSSATARMNSVQRMSASSQRYSNTFNPSFIRDDLGRNFPHRSKATRGSTLPKLWHWLIEVSRTQGTTALPALSRHSWNGTAQRPGSRRTAHSKCFSCARTIYTRNSLRVAVFSF